VAKLFFLLSGEHETLPVSELKAILEAEGCAFRLLEKLDQVVMLEADSNCVEAIRRRAALTRLCGLELFNCEANISTIVGTARLTDFEKALQSGEKFAVRVKRVKNHSPKLNSMILERKLGEAILNRTTQTRVDLKNPEKILIGILTENKFVFGLKLAEIQPKSFVERRPKHKPFFHPSAMPAKLARCMVNLAKPKSGELVLDPFSGTGSMLIEAALISCRVLGLDIQKRMVRGTRKNLTYFGIKPEGLIVADAKNSPIAKVDCVVTDPPYGISATTLRRTTRQIVEEVLMAVYDILEKESRVCIAAPKTLGIGRLAVTLGYRHLESHFVYVHRSLTREIAVIEKM
jgi:tRNA (guanine10-N2)-dimethyltransferase